MDLRLIRDRLKIGLNNVILESGNPLHMQLTDREINDIANTLTHNLPPSYQVEMTNIHTEILSHLPGNSVERLLYSERSGILPSDTTKHLKHKLFVIMYTLFLLGEEMDESIEEMFALYRSFVVDMIDLNKEVAANPANGTALMINDFEAVRLAEGKFVPSIKTIEKFKHLL